MYRMINMYCIRKLNHNFINVKVYRITILGKCSPVKTLISYITIYEYLFSPSCTRSNQVTLALPSSVTDTIINIIFISLLLGPCAEWFGRTDECREEWKWAGHGPTDLQCPPLWTEGSDAQLSNCHCCWSVGEQVCYLLTVGTY